MRKQSGFNIRVKLSDAEGHEIHTMALRENRSLRAERPQPRATS
jgi:hypothetical protein